MSTYVAPQRPKPYGPIYTPKEPDDMTEAEAVSRASYPPPSDIVQGALNVFRENLLERDRIEPDLMTAGALRYFFQYYGPGMAAQQVRYGIPGTANGWGGYSVSAVREAMRVYDRDQKPQEPAQPGVHPSPLAPPIRTDGQTFQEGA